MSVSIRTENIFISECMGFSRLQCGVRLVIYKRSALHLIVHRLEN